MKHRPYDKRAPIGYVPGVFPSMELLSARPDIVRELLYSPQGERNEGLAKLIERCRDLRIPTTEAPRALERIAGRENCYAALAFEKYQDKLDDGLDHVVLCGVSDMGNLGTIVRTCLGMGVADIAIIRPAADRFDPRAVRSSMGALFRARTREFDDFRCYEQQAGARSFLFFRLQNAVSIEDIGLQNRPISLVFGNESSGLTGDLLTRDAGVVIPHSDQIDSLNLSVAVGIGLYAIARRK